MRTRERSEHKITGIRMPWMHLKLSTLFDSVCTGHKSEFCCRNCGPTIIVGVYAQYQSLAAFDISMYPLNLIGINIRCAHFHGSGQVDDYLPSGGWLPNIYDSLTNLKGIVHFGTGKALG